MDYCPKLKRWLSFSLLCAEGNFRKWVQAGIFPAATSALGWPSPRNQGHTPCGQQFQASVSHKKPFRWCGNCMRPFRLQWDSSFVTLQALGEKLPDSLHSLGGGCLFLWIHEVYMFLRANHWEVHLVFLSRYLQLDKGFHNMILRIFPSYC